MLVCTCISMAAGCRLLAKCFCLCCCWTWRAKPEPRIPCKQKHLENKKHKILEISEPNFIKLLNSFVLILYQFQFKRLQTVNSWTFQCLLYEKQWRNNATIHVEQKVFCVQSTCIIRIVLNGGKSIPISYLKGQIKLKV